jgi:hypothetical protein
MTTQVTISFAIARAKARVKALVTLSSTRKLACNLTERITNNVVVIN